MCARRWPCWKTTHKEQCNVSLSHAREKIVRVNACEVRCTVHKPRPQHWTRMHPAVESTFRGAKNSVAVRGMGNLAGTSLFFNRIGVQLGVSRAGASAAKEVSFWARECIKKKRTIITFETSCHPAKNNVCTFSSSELTKSHEDVFGPSETRENMSVIERWVTRFAMSFCVS